MGGQEDVREEHKQLSSLAACALSSFKVGVLRDWARLVPGPGTHPTIQEELKVTRGRQQVGLKEVSWETGNEEGGAACVK